jgi:hypothetical protein
MRLLYKREGINKFIGFILEISGEKTKKKGNIISFLLHVRLFLTKIMVLWLVGRGRETSHHGD